MIVITSGVAVFAYIVISIFGHNSNYHIVSNIIEIDIQTVTIDTSFNMTLWYTWPIKVLYYA